MRELTSEEKNALHWFAWENGRCWKQALRDEWQRACSRLPERVDCGRIEYRSTLQRLRNDPEFSLRGLEKYRLPDGFVFRSR